MYQVTCLSIERAIEINNMCVAHVWYREGVKKELPPSLDKISLPEMLEAAKIVENMRPRQMICDHRFLAALYVAYNYQADDQEELVPVAINISGSAVCVIQLPSQEE